MTPLRWRSATIHPGGYREAPRTQAIRTRHHEARQHGGDIGVARAGQPVEREFTVGVGNDVLDEVGPRSLHASPQARWTEAEPLAGEGYDALAAVRGREYGVAARQYAPVHVALELVLRGAGHGRGEAAIGGLVEGGTAVQIRRLGGRDHAAHLTSTEARVATRRFACGDRRVGGAVTAQPRFGYSFTMSAARTRSTASAGRLTTSSASSRTTRYAARSSTRSRRASHARDRAGGGRLLPRSAARATPGSPR